MIDRAAFARRAFVIGWLAGHRREANAARMQRRCSMRLDRGTVATTPAGKCAVML